MVEKITLDPCPWCGKTPVWGLGQRTYCQLHGEPRQPVRVKCQNDLCPVKPKLETGDIHLAGTQAARLEASKRWNRG